MSYFPVISSTLSSAHLCGFLRQKYNLGPNTTCRLLKAGINHTYLVVDGLESYVFRVYSYNWRTKKEITEEIRLLDTLRLYGIPVSFALPDENDHFIQQLNAPEGKRIGVLFSFAKGDKILNLSSDMHFKIGQVMAKLHEVTHNLKLERIEYTPQVLLVDSLEQIKKFLPSNSDEMTFMQSAQEYLIHEFSEIKHHDVRTGIVHLDIWFDNLNIYQDREITIFDFDFCGNGMLCLDMAYYILQVNSTEKDEIECKSKVERFLEGYESITPISNEEKRLLPMLGVTMYFFYLGVQSQRFDNWSNTFLNETYLKRFINLLVKKYYDANKLGQYSM